MTEKPILPGPDGIEPIALRDALEERYLAATVALDNKLIAHLDNAVRGAKADAEGRNINKSWPRASGTGGCPSRCATGMRN